MLSPQVAYAAKALAHVVGAEAESLSVQDIAAATGIPPAYLAKIVHRLARKGLVATRRGVGGGVASNPRRPLAAVTLHDLCLALDDAAIETRCLIGEDECSDERACPAHAFWSPQRKRLIEFLRKTTLRDVARFETRRRREEKEPR